MLAARCFDGACTCPAGGCNMWVHCPVSLSLALRCDVMPCHPPGRCCACSVKTHCVSVSLCHGRILPHVTRPFLQGRDQHMMLHRCRMDILRHECLMLCVCRLPAGSCCEAVQQYIGQQWAQPTSPAKTLHRVVKADAPIEKAKQCRPAARLHVDAKCHVRDLACQITPRYKCVLAVLVCFIC